MIEILGSKVSFFTLYGLVSLQAIVIGCLIVAAKLGTKTDSSGFPLAMPAYMVAGLGEVMLLLWMAAL